MSTVGFLGLGAMGSAMAGRLIDAGHDVVLWNRSAGAVEPLVTRGGRAAATPAEALSSDVAICMLADDRAVEAVLDARALAATRGRTVVMTASISPDLSASLAERVAAAGGTYIAAPVLGRPAAAADGKLNIMTAGPVEAVDAVSPLLEVLGVRVWRVAERAAVAHAVKAAVNYNIIHAMQAIGESVAMTERWGVDPELFTTLLSQTLFGGVVYTGYGSIIASGAYDPPGFHISLGRKDLELAAAVAAAGDVHPPTLPVLMRVFDTALADPALADLDWSAIAEVTRRDLPLVPEHP